MTESTYLRTTREAYETVATDYTELLGTELEVKPLDRAMLAAFAELAQASDARTGRRSRLRPRPRDGAPALPRG